MILALHTMPIRRRRDVVLARQRARQIAGLLGFDHDRQVRLASAVFALAAEALLAERAFLTFELHDDFLHAFCRGDCRKSDHGSSRRPLRGVEWGTTLPRLMEPVFDHVDTPARADLPWLIDELARHTPLSLFEEFEIQNEELLRAYQRAELRQAV